MRYLILILSVIALSCGKKDDNPNEISFWHFWSEPNQRKALQLLIDDFEKETGYKVKTTELSWNDGKIKLMAAFNSKTPPDVLELGSDWVAQFSSSGVLQDITSEIDMNKYIESSWDPSYWNKKVYALPWIVDTRMMFVNHHLYNGDVNSFEEILEGSKFLDSVDFEYPRYWFGVNGADKNRLYKKAISFLWSAGGGLIEGDSCILYSKENIKALQMYADLRYNGLIEKQRNLDELFIKGDLAFNISGGWLVKKIEAQNPDLDYSVQMFPGINGHPGISFAGGEYLSLSKKDKIKQSALEFIKFITDGKNTIKFCKQLTEAGFPADKDYYQDEYYMKDPKRKHFARQLELARMTTVHPEWFAIQDELERCFERALYEDTPVDIILKESDAKIQALINQ